MDGGISAPFIRHPIATSLLMVGILFVGIVAYPRLPVAPLPQVDFPTIQVSAQLARRQPRDHGLRRGAAAGDAIRADPRRRADDLDRARLARPRSPSSSISTATSMAPRTTCRPRSTPPAANCRKTCRARRPIARSIPADSPDPPARRDLRHAAADRGRRQCRDQARPADQPDCRRRPGHSSAASRSPRSASSSIPPSSSPKACRSKTSACRSRSRPWTIPRARSTAADALLHDLHQRSADPVQGLERRHRRLSQRRRRCGCATSARR